MGIACALALIGLAVLYRTGGDRTLVGEALTIWPPELWALAGLACAALLSLWDRRGAVGVLVAAAVLVAAVSEWRSLFRTREPAQARARGVIRLVTWNVARSPDLSSLSSMAPDIVFFQEAAPVSDQAGVTPFRNGFHWAGTLDPALFTRFPIESLPSPVIGPWAPPQIAVLGLPDGRRLLVVNVRLALPGVVLKIASPGDAIDLESAHATRIAQYARLASTVADTRRAQGGIPAVVCGDFNTPGHAASLRDLAPLADVWPRVGRGWGGTMGADLPVARIDQCWISDGIRPVAAWVEKGRSSDHRMVVVDFEVG
jgi:endonuclease/exonuclease/phosphatase (EEP) superfamily protein YafD